MYPHLIKEHSLVMLLDVNLDHKRESDLNWFKELLNESLNLLNENNFLVIITAEREKLDCNNLSRDVAIDNKTDKSWLLVYKH